MNRITAPIPARLQSRPKDRRGYPVPFSVFVDNEGRPHFQIADPAALAFCAEAKVCSLCGKPLGNNIWFVGGAGAAFHPNGAYLDPPMHKDCGTFALQTCPFICMPYSKRIDEKTLDAAAAIDYVLVKDENSQDKQPPFFVFSRTSGFKASDQGFGTKYFHPRRPWQEVQFWHHGKQITEQDAERLFAERADNTFQRNDLTWWKENNDGSQLGPVQD